MAQQHVGNVGRFQEYDPFKRLASAVITRAVADLNSGNQEIYDSATSFLKGSMYPFDILSDFSIPRNKLDKMIEESRNIDRSSGIKDLKPISPPSQVEYARCRRAFAFFNKGFTVGDLKSKFSSEKEAESWLVKKRWPKGYKCVYCGFKAKSQKSNDPFKQYRCTSCNKEFGIRSKSLMENSRLTSRTWLIAAYAIITDPSMQSGELMHIADVSQASAWRMRKQIQDMWNAGRKFPLWE